METEKQQPTPQQGKLPTLEEALRKLQEAQQLNFDRSRNLFGQITDALGATVYAAENGHPGAKHDLKLFLDHMERAKTAVHGIARG